MIERIVARVLLRPWLTILAATLLTGFGFAYAATHFAITTDTARLLSPDLPYRQSEIAFAAAFPQTTDLVVAVIDASSFEAADDAARRLAAALTAHPEVFRTVSRPDASPFLAQNGLLLLPTAEVARATGALSRQAGVLALLNHDPTLRGLAETVTSLLQQSGDPRALAGLAPVLSGLTKTLQSAVAGVPKTLSWRALLDPGSSALAPDNAGEGARRIVLIQPVLDFGALEPGAAAIDLLRRLATDAGLTAANGIQLALTGAVPLADDEFATLAENAALNAALTIAAIGLILYVALRSGRLILAVLATLVVGLVITAAIGLALVGELNLISVAFAVLFVGLGVDFGIQVGTRYRAERFASAKLRPAILSAVRAIGLSLTLAAASLLAGFFSFLPTEFSGVSELGLIAGVGMVVAYVASLTLLPCLMTVLRLPPEHRPVATASLARVDRFIAGHRRLVIGLTAVATLAGLPYLLTLTFDSNPMNLRSQTVQSVATFLDLSANPRTAPNMLDVLVASEGAIGSAAARLEALAEVDHVTSIETFLPQDQEAKLGLIRNAAAFLGPALGSTERAPSPDDAETINALWSAAQALRLAASAVNGPAAAPAAGDPAAAPAASDPTTSDPAAVSAISDPGAVSVIEDPAAVSEANAPTARPTANSPAAAPAAGDPTAVTDGAGSRDVARLDDAAAGAAVDGPVPSAAANSATTGAVENGSPGAGEGHASAAANPIAGELTSLASVLSDLADASPTTRESAQAAVFANFPQFIESVRLSLSAEPVTRGTLPADLVASWVAANGRARIQVSPSGNSNDNTVIQAFADAVRTVAPDASGPPIGITEAGKVIVRAFLQAGVFALVTITVILWLALRRIGDVLLALGPLVLAGILTLEFASLIGLPLNFANVIALPLMFGVGVAFHIYYLLAWRAGIADVLASSLTRAIFFSALTTGTAFGSLWASSHPGTSSMGELLSISLVFTLGAAFFVVPAFLGPPPEGASDGGFGRRGKLDGVDALLLSRAKR